jgi:hypothetical protein
MKKQQTKSLFLHAVKEQITTKAMLGGGYYA